MIVITYLLPCLSTFFKKMIRMLHQVPKQIDGNLFVLIAFKSITLSVMYAELICP